MTLYITRAYRKMFKYYVHLFFLSRFAMFRESSIRR